MNHAMAAAIRDELPTDDELDALADELADAFEDRADQERKGER